MKRLLHLWAFSLILPLVFAFSWPWPVAASNLSKEKTTSALLDMPYLSLLQLPQEKNEKEKAPQPAPKVENPEVQKEAKNPNKEKVQKEAKNPNKAEVQKEAQNPNKANVQKDSQKPNKTGDGSSLSTVLIIGLLVVVGATGLWLVLRRRSS